MSHMVEMMLNQRRRTQTKTVTKKGESEDEVRARMVANRINGKPKDEDDTVLDIKKKSKAHNAFLFINELEGMRGKLEAEKE